MAQINEKWQNLYSKYIEKDQDVTHTTGLFDVESSSQQINISSKIYEEAVDPYKEKNSITVTNVDNFKADLIKIADDVAITLLRDVLPRYNGQLSQDYKNKIIKTQAAENSTLTTIISNDVMRKQMAADLREYINEHKSILPEADVFYLTCFQQMLEANRLARPFDLAEGVRASALATITFEDENGMTTTLAEKYPKETFKVVSNNKNLNKAEKEAFEAVNKLIAERDTRLTSTYGLESSMEGNGKYACYLEIFTGGNK